MLFNDEPYLKRNILVFHMNICSFQLPSWLNHEILLSFLQLFKTFLSIIGVCLCSAFLFYFISSNSSNLEITIFIFTFLCSPNDLHLNSHIFESHLFSHTHIFNIKIKMRFIAMADDGNGRCITWSRELNYTLMWLFDVLWLKV